MRSMAASGLREQRLFSLSSDARVSLDLHCPTLQDDDMVVTRNMDPASKGYGSVGVHVKPEAMLRLLQHFPSFNSLMHGKVRLPPLIPTPCTLHPNRRVDFSRNPNASAIGFLEADKDHSNNQHKNILMSIELFMMIILTPTP